MNLEEISSLWADLDKARIRVYLKYGFSEFEICKIMDLPEKIIRNIIKQIKSEESRKH